MSGALDGRAALVTGGGRNIGRAIALALAAEGAWVAVNARSNRAEAEAVAAEIADRGGRSLAVLADVADPDAVARMTENVLTEFGGLDILVNNAAIRAEIPFVEMDYAAWRRVLDVCLDGAFHCTKATLPALIASDAGAVVNIGGLTGHAGAAERAHVITAKAGLAGFTRALANDLAPHDVTVNLVAPGMMDTVRAPSSTSGTPRHHANRTTLLGRKGQPEEVAAAVVWLAGPGGRFVTGQSIHVNGGAWLAG